jgi:hypothetical protein
MWLAGKIAGRRHGSLHNKCFAAKRFGCFAGLGRHRRQVKRSASDDHEWASL